MRTLLVALLLVASTVRAVPSESAEARCSDARFRRTCSINPDLSGWLPGYMVPGFRAYRYVGVRSDGGAMYEPILQEGETSPAHVHSFIGGAVPFRADCSVHEPDGRRRQQTCRGDSAR